MRILGIDTFEKVFGHNPSLRFKGGGDDPPSSQMPDTEMRKYARETLYPMVRRGLKGKGFGTSQVSNLRTASLSEGLDKSYQQVKGETESGYNQYLDPKDIRVRSFMSNTLNREYITKKDDLKRMDRQEKVADTDLSMGMANSYLAGEKRMSMDTSGMYNQALQQNTMNAQQFGTFGTNVASGIGTGTAGYLYAQKMGKTA